MSTIARQQGSTICTHVSSDIGTNCIGFSQLLECAQNGIVQERTALNDNFSAHFMGVANFDYLEQGIFNNGKSQAGSDVTNRGTFLLSLLNATVHEHRTTAAQINRIFSLDSALSEFRYIKIQARCKAFNKRTAARGARLVQHDVVNHAVLNAQTLHVLTTNIQNELNAWKHFLRATEMRNRFNLAGIHTQSFEQQCLTIAGNRNMGNVHLGLARFIDRKLLIQLGNSTLRAP